MLQESLKIFWLGLITHSFASQVEPACAQTPLMTGTNYDGTPCIIKKYKSATENLNHSYFTGSSLQAVFRYS